MRDRNVSNLLTFPFFLSHRTLVETIFGMSYMYYAVLGTFVTIIVAIIVSYCTASEEDAFDENLLHPCVRKLRHWYNNTTPMQSQDIEHSAASNVNRAYEMTEATGTDAIEEVGDDTVHSQNRRASNGVESNGIAQKPVERFKQINFS